VSDVSTGYDVATPFRARTERALQDTFLQQALTIATTKFIDLRGQAFGEFPEGEALRDRARRSRGDAAAPGPLARRAGGKRGGARRHVHFAATAAEARSIVLDIGRRTGARLAVKSKSMATEEIELNEALLHAGITPCRDRPRRVHHPEAARSHHTSSRPPSTRRRAGGRTLRPRARRKVAADPEELTRIARAELREKFLPGRHGHHGCQLRRGRDGHHRVVTNEGNGRMVTSLPRVHVAVMGIEKVVPSMTDLTVFLSILARSATGQKMSVYTTLVQPRRPGELEGPEELHLVLLDNGRMRQVSGPLRESLYCLRCGACLNVCPCTGRSAATPMATRIPVRSASWPLRC
jgi:L-lactate dehydrogenase complex protein LldF